MHSNRMHTARLEGGSAQPPGCRHPLEADPPPDRILDTRDACENITFPQLLLRAIMTTYNAKISQMIGIYHNINYFLAVS